MRLFVIPKLLPRRSRADRETVIGRVRGVSFSGKRQDAFHSVHCAGTLRPGPRRAIRLIALGLSMTRVVVLAHWVSDVVIGFALGAALERLLQALDRLCGR